MSVSIGTVKTKEFLSGSTVSPIMALAFRSGAPTDGLIFRTSHAPATALSFDIEVWLHQVGRDSHQGTDVWCVAVALNIWVLLFMYPVCEVGLGVGHAWEEVFGQALGEAFLLCICLPERREVFSELLISADNRAVFAEPSDTVKTGFGPWRSISLLHNHLYKLPHDVVFRSNVVLFNHVNMCFNRSSLHG